MRILLFILVFINAFLCMAQSYEVKSIRRCVFDETGLCISYLIEASRNDSLFFIFSDCKENAEFPKEMKIKKRHRYDFQLMVVYPGVRGIIKLDSISGRLIIVRPEIHSYGMTSDDRHHNKIYKSLNTNGKYMVP